MNGSIAFARTLRALDADGFRISKFALAGVAALLACWTWWILSARIPQYETSQNVQIEPGSLRAVADFPPSVLERIHPGQSAELRVEGVQRSIRAEVTSVGQDSGIQLKLLEPPATSHQPLATARATAIIAVDRVSPLAIAMRAAGRARR